ncbi:MAG: hypothetical protein AB7V46_03750 [Thermomicrobiales bacterium]
MASISADFHAQRGQRLMNAGEWVAAEREFARALIEAGSEPTPEMLAGRAAATLRSPCSWQRKVEALRAANTPGQNCPQFWALSMRSYLQILDQLDGRNGALSPNATRQLQELRHDVANLVTHGTTRFQSCFEAGDRNAWPWGAALVAMGDWLYEFEGIEAGRFGRAPYRPIAATLYRPVAETDLSSLFDDPETQRDIRTHLTLRAQMLLYRLGPAASARPKRRGRPGFEPSGWTLIAIRPVY